MSDRSTGPRPYSTFRVKGRLYLQGLRHALFDTAHALALAALACAGLALLYLVWDDGPFGLASALRLLQVAQPLPARVVATVLLAVPLAVFVRSALANFSVVLGDPRALQRDLDLLWARVAERDREGGERR